MAVYDVFPFFNELEILEIRLNMLDEVVDYFLITEGTTTFSGNRKRLFLSENIELFKKFKEKIIIQVVELPNLDPFRRDDYQKNHAKIILDERLNDSDLILCGDVDEIPKPESVLDASNKLSDNIKIAHFAQNLNQHYLNLKESSGTILSFAGEYKNITDKKWLGTTLSKWSYAKQFSMNELRYPIHKEVGCRIEDGGWHFSWVGGEYGLSIEERARIKLASTSHQEFNNHKILKKINRRLSKNQDIIGRKHANFETITDLNYLPEYVQKNLAKFDHLLAK